MAPYIQEPDMLSSSEYWVVDRRIVIAIPNPSDHVDPHRLAIESPKHGIRHSLMEATAPLDTVHDLSFGVELKFLLPLLVQGERDPEPEDHRKVNTTRLRDSEATRREQVYECIAKSISQAGEKSTTISRITKDASHERAFWKSHWIVKKANSAEPTPEQANLEGYVWLSVEVSSPSLPAKDAETRHRIEAVLRSLFSNHRLVANYTCEVHIHIGRTDGQSFSLSTLKRLGTLLWMGEEQIRSIRNPRSPNYHNVYTWGFETRKYSRLALRAQELALREHGSASHHDDVFVEDWQVTDVLETHPEMQTKDRKAIEELWKAGSHVDLGRLLSGEKKPYRRLGFNFSAFGQEDERARNNPRTMEFRMMEGTTNINYILGWLSICKALAEVAVGRSDSRYPMVLDRLIGQRHARSRSAGARRETVSETQGQRCGREFREMMDDLGVPRDVYRDLEAKVTLENEV
ncbi:hypothetical protein SMACR_00290 [Sordaria macrospora]|uniref:Amidoligase enzyme n=1 Tax=Sordaria macrospora TaxID=5147 RepID=A0A8S9A952_SORMA|nr:hypothetical protein SMACR_00290 [Sordaria macrospora]KAH7634157.1 hypothetical protein B0T09DRAFT_387 [Sordaria sp. MPI-SDFR-AT-0083]WPJ59035.1 hypothetical protein SMAC4_00290 [Sordaria macrospora]